MLVRTALKTIRPGEGSHLGWAGTPSIPHCSALSAAGASPKSPAATRGLSTSLTCKEEVGGKRFLRSLWNLEKRACIAASKITVLWYTLLGTVVATSETIVHILVVDRVLPSAEKKMARTKQVNRPLLRLRPRAPPAMPRGLVKNKDTNGGAAPAPAHVSPSLSHTGTYLDQPSQLTLEYLTSMMKDTFSDKGNFSRPPRVLCGR